MLALAPLFHMNGNYMWQWYVTDGEGRLALMSAHEFFYFEDARRDYEATRSALGNPLS